MLQVPIDKILPVTEARANISKLVDDVEKGNVYVLTRGGKPAVVVASVKYIAKLTGNSTAASSVMVENSHAEKPRKNSVQKLEPKNVKLKEENKNSSGLPELIENTTNEISNTETKETIPDVYNKPEEKIVLQEEEAVPIKIKTGSWNK